VGADGPDAKGTDMYSICCLVGYCLAPLVVHSGVALVLPRCGLRCSWCLPACVLGWLTGCRRLHGCRCFVSCRVRAHAPHGVVNREAWQGIEGIRGICDLHCVDGSCSDFMRWGMPTQDVAAVVQDFLML
jgi:hypothetical protein